MDKESRDLNLDARFIEQEHRLVHVLINAYDAIRYWPKDDPRRKGALRALLWRLFSPGNAAAMGIGIVAISGLLISLVTAGLLEQQNEKLDQQTHLAEASRSAAMLQELASIVTELERFTNSACIPDQIAKKNKLKRCWPNVPPEVKTRWLKTWIVFNAPPELKDIADELDLTEGTLPLSPELSGRVSAFTQAVRPYRYMQLEKMLTSDGSSERRKTVIGGAIGWLSSLTGVSSSSDPPILIDKPLSPERGIIFTILARNELSLSVNAHADIDLRNSDLRGRRLVASKLYAFRMNRSDFSCSILNRADLDHSTLDDTRFVETDLAYATLRNASLKSADLSGADLRNSCLPESKNFEDSNLEDADLDDAFVPEKDWLSSIGASRAKGIDTIMWKIAATRTPNECGDKWRWQIQRIKNRSDLTQHRDRLCLY